MQTGRFMIKVTVILTHISFLQCEALMTMRTGCRNKSLFLQMPGTRGDGRYMIRLFQCMIRKIARELLNTAFQSWMKTVIRKPASAKGRARNICGRRLRYRLTIGMTGLRQESGVPRGRSTATGILTRIIRLITEATRDRD